MENIEFVLPSEIEKRSFQIIESELNYRGIYIPEEQKPITMRVIHTSADFEYAAGGGRIAKFSKISKRSIQ